MAQARNHEAYSPEVFALVSRALIGLSRYPEGLTAEQMGRALFGYHGACGPVTSRMINRAEKMDLWPFLVRNQGLTFLRVRRPRDASLYKAVSPDDVALNHASVGVVAQVRGLSLRGFNTAPATETGDEVAAILAEIKDVIPFPRLERLYELLHVEAVA